MATFDRIADLPVEIDGYSLEGREQDVSSAFTRLTTLITIRGGGEEGVGEDVTYDALDHIALQDAGAVHDLSGRTTIGELCERIGALDLFPAEPVREVSRRYRRWAFESAALDLALRQAGRSLADALGLEARPVTFVNSKRLDDENPSAEPIKRLLARYPTLRFKLDPTAAWTEELIAELAATGAVDSVDFKGFYEGTPVDNPADPALYRRVAEGFPDAWLEDPKLTPETEEILAPHRDRITWDAPIHAVADIEALPFKPRMVNVKPSRMGGLQELMAAYDHCAAQGIGAYGGGQFELGVGRGHIQYLASLFHPDTPNDIAPTGYNLPDPPDGLPASPLDPAPAPTGFRWG